MENGKTEERENSQEEVNVACHERCLSRRPRKPLLLKTQNSSSHASIAAHVANRSRFKTERPKTYRRRWRNPQEAFVSGWATAALGQLRPHRLGRHSLRPLGNHGNYTLASKYSTFETLHWSSKLTSSATYSVSAPQHQISSFVRNTKGSVDVV